MLRISTCEKLCKGAAADEAGRQHLIEVEMAPLYD